MKPAIETHNWKLLLEKAVAKNYPATKIKWNGDHPAPLIPDELQSKSVEISEYIADLWSAWTGITMSASQLTTTQTKNIKEIARRLAPGKFTKQAAMDARHAAEILFAAHPQSKQLSFIGYLNTICLFLEAAERNMPNETATENPSITHQVEAH